MCAHIRVCRFMVWCDSCVHLCVHARVTRACMGTWEHGCMGAWVHGCMGVWVHATSGRLCALSSPMRTSRPVACACVYACVPARAHVCDWCVCACMAFILLDELVIDLIVPFLHDSHKKAEVPSIDL